MLIRYVTLWPWTLTRWPWKFVVHQASCDRSLHEIWAKSSNPQLINLKKKFLSKTWGLPTYLSGGLIKAILDDSNSGKVTSLNFVHNSSLVTSVLSSSGTTTHRCWWMWIVTVSVTAFAPESVLMETVAATAIQIHHDIADVSDDVDDDDDDDDGRGCWRTLGHTSSSSEIRAPLVGRAVSRAAATGFQTESHFHQNECSRARASDGQNIYCRRVINNVGTGWAPGFGCVSPRYRSRSGRKIYMGIVRRRAGTPAGRGPGRTWYWQPVCWLSERRPTWKPYSALHHLRHLFQSNSRRQRRRTVRDWIVTYDALVSSSTGRQTDRPTGGPSAVSVSRMSSAMLRVTALLLIIIIIITIIITAPCEAGAPLFPPCPFTSSSFPPFYFSLSFIGFTYFLLLSIPSLYGRIVPLRFQVGGRRRRPNLGLVCVLLCTLCYLYSLVKMGCGVLFYLV